MQSPFNPNPISDPDRILLPSGDSLQDVTSQLAARSGGGVSWNTAGVTLSFDLRSDFVTYLSSHAAKHANGDRVSAAGIEYIYESGLTQQSALPNWRIIGGALRANLTLSIPTDFATLQAALDAYAPVASNGYTITLNIESGHSPASGLDNSDIDLGWIEITSTDATVSLHSTFSGEAFIKHTGGVAPKLSTVIDCVGYAPIGVFITQAVMAVSAGCGVKNAAIIGSGVNGVGFFVYENSELTCTPEDLGSGTTGILVEGNARRGIQTTWGSRTVAPYSVFTNNGTDITDADEHCAALISRTSFAQFDNSTFSGGAGRGIRSARSGVSAREVTMTNIEQPAWLFEGGFIEMSFSTFAGCGLAGYPLFQVRGTSDDTPQGAGIINASSATITTPQSPIADAKAVGASVNIDNATITDLLSHLATAGRGGSVSAALASCTLNASYGSANVVVIGDGAEFMGLGLTITGGGYATNGVNVANGAKAHLRNASFSGLTNDYVVASGGTVFTEGMTFSSGSSVEGVLETDRKFLNPPAMPSGTVAEINANWPAASWTNCWVYCTDDVGGAVMAFSDGTYWRRTTDRAAITT